MGISRINILTAKATILNKINASLMIYFCFGKYSFSRYEFFWNASG